MPFNPVVAIRLTPYYARLAGWADLCGRVFAVLGFRTRPPTAGEFVAAARRWQLDHPPLAADGLLGPATWATLAPAVRAYRGRVAAGTRPDWLDPPSRKFARTATTPPAWTADGPEDRAIQELVLTWATIADRRLGDPCLPVPVGAARAGDDARRGVPSLATGDICETLRVGQVWQGVSGADRIVVALTGPGRRVRTGVIDFLTDSGRAYRQHSAGWVADVMAGVYAGNGRAPTPLQTLLPAEVQALLGATAAAGADFPAAAPRGAAQWVVQNRDDIAAWVTAAGPVTEAAARLRMFAPTLSDAVLRGTLGGVLMDAFESAAGSERPARLVGMLLVRPGKDKLARQAAVVIGALAALADRKAVPVGGAAPSRAAVAGLVRDQRRFGLAVGPDAAARILGEIGANPVEVKDLIGRLRRGLRALA
ncbi:MAG TPA: hypothetical protein VGF55_20020 [Gemmataceae bacterium]|jgi:hypothetical protein